MTGKRLDGQPQFIGTCAEHEKHLWVSKKEAKRAAKIKHPGEQLSAYRCDITPQYWHYGHLHPLVIQRGVDFGRGGRG